MEFLEFKPILVHDCCAEKVQSTGVIPKEMDIFSNTEEYFLPEGKTFADLTPEEAEDLKNKYRFSPMIPGCYQGITGFGHMM